MSITHSMGNMVWGFFLWSVLCCVWFSYSPSLKVLQPTLLAKFWQKSEKTSGHISVGGTGERHTSPTQLCTGELETINKWIDRHRRCCNLSHPTLTKSPLRPFSPPVCAPVYLNIAVRDFSPRVQFSLSQFPRCRRCSTSILYESCII